MALESGTQLGHYEITDQIGKGGMGEVWRARDTKLGREVAIKVLPAEFAQDSERLARLEREARMLAALNHPNIGGIYGLEESHDVRFLVLELVEGDTIADRLKRGAIPVEESLKLALQIAEALEAAHEKGVVHRDLKPANIKITPEGRVKVLDFGLAKVFLGDHADVNLSNSPTLSMDATQAGMILGTAAYMSPEQASGEVADHRADVWAFGVVLFEMLTGRQLFTGKTAAHVMGAVLNIEPDWDSLPLNLHPRVRVLLERLLEKETRDRLSGVSDARVEIQKVLADSRGVLVESIAEVVPTATQSKLPWVAVIVLVGIVASLGGWFVKPSEPRQVYRFDFELPAPQVFANASTVDISPDSTRVVYTAGGLHLLDLENGLSLPIPGGEGRVSNPKFSPDGQRIAYLDRNQDGLLNIPPSGGAPIRVTDLDDSWDLDWMDDDTILVIQQSRIMQVPANGGTPEPVFEIEGSQIDTPQLLPGGNAVLFTSLQSGSPQAMVALLGSRETLALPVFGSAARYLPTGHIAYVYESDLWAVPFDLGGLEVLGTPTELETGIRNNGLQASYGVSDTGGLVYVPGGETVGGPPATLVTVDRNGEGPSITEEYRPYRNPKTSPQGNRIAVEVIENTREGEIHIYVVDVESGVGNPLTTEGGVNIAPTWTADGNAVVFASDRSGSAGLDLYSRNADGTGQAEPVLSGDVDLIPVDVIPGTDVLLFEERGNPVKLRTLDLSEEGSDEDFVYGESNVGSAAASPDGRWVAYTEGTTGAGGFEVWVIPYPRATDTPRRVSDGPGSWPMWSPGGDEIYFTTFDDTTGIAQLTSASVETSPAFSRRGIAPLFSLSGAFVFGAARRGYDVIGTVDGQRFLFVQPVGTADQTVEQVPRINIVLNWLEEVGERVPVP